MDYSIIGFPRIGIHRELKFATEAYFRSEIDADELKRVVSQQRMEQWTRQRDAGAGFIPSNDFSLYDGMLDTAYMLNAIPRRYADLRLSDIDTYFAMARGYQGAQGDVKAFTMKKWFNTNYHYMVPELDDDMELKLRSDAFLDGFHQARSLGIQTKPVVAGPFTFLKLARCTGNKSATDFVDDILFAYADILKRCGENGVEWLQVDEPYLVMDLTMGDVALFRKLYQTLLEQKGTVKVLLQTYFGDVRDCYRQLCELPFDGIGLDFVEGKQTAALVAANGFPKDKILFAGLVNGKNIWKNHYEKTLQTVKGLQEKNISVVLSTSCSLLHVPYTLKHETKLPKECSAYFAFAEEKLTELQELGVLADLADYTKAESYQNNHRLFAEKRDCENDGVRERLSRITEQDAVRLPKRSERQKLQKAEFGLPEFPTTTIGSFPQTRDVKANRSAYRKGEKTKEEYEAFNRAKIAECVAWQEEIGLDVLVHGEYERNDMVEYFGEALGGFLFTEKGWVQSYGTRCVKPPVIWGDVYRKSPITVAWSVYAQSLTKKIMKGMLSGPVTILNWSFPREDISIRESISQIALAIRDEVLDLEANGIRMIQIDEAALREKLPLRKSDWYSEYLDFAIPAFRLTHSGVEAETQIHTHMCYSEFTDIIPAIDDMDADVITFEASRSDLQILDSLRENHFETEVGPGVYDIHSPRVPSVEEMVQSLTVMLTKIPKEKLWVNPDCGLKTRGVPEADASLRNMVKAAEEIRKKFS